MHLVINGDKRDFPELQDGADVHALVQLLGFRADRVALETNGDIIPRTAWADTLLAEGDKLEVVHFVGGGTCSGLGRWDFTTEPSLSLSSRAVQASP